MNDDNSNDPLLKAIDDIQVENHKQLELLTQKIRLLEQYIKNDEVFKRTEIMSSEGKKEVTISVDNILTDIADLFLIKRDKNFLSTCLKIIQEKLSILNTNNTLDLIKTKRIHEIQYSLDKAIADFEESLKSIQTEVSRNTDYWNEIDSAEKALLYLPQYKYIQNLLKEVEITDLDGSLIKNQIEQFIILKNQYNTIIQPVDEFEIAWTD